MHRCALLCSCAPDVHYGTSLGRILEAVVIVKICPPAMQGGEFLMWFSVNIGDRDFSCCEHSLLCLSSYPKPSESWRCVRCRRFRETFQWSWPAAKSLASTHLYCIARGPPFANLGPVPQFLSFWRLLRISFCMRSHNSSWNASMLSFTRRWLVPNRQSGTSPRMGVCKKIARTQRRRVVGIIAHLRERTHVGYGRCFF